jgi:hypothetical protein
VAVRRRGRRGVATPVAKKGEATLIQIAREYQQQGNQYLTTNKNKSPKEVAPQTTLEEPSK